MTIAIALLCAAINIFMTNGRNISCSAAPRSPRSASRQIELKAERQFGSDGGECLGAQATDPRSSRKQLRW
jgi:hypothetical protein